LCLIGEYFNNVLKISLENYIVISGPCHAEEIALERLSYLTVASQNINLAKLLERILKNNYVKVKCSNDIIGTEYSAVLKNIYAIASGIANGLNYGDNFQSVLISNSIREMQRFICNISKIKRDINQTVYLGDLLVTSYSKFSRNRTFGNMIGKGYSVKTALIETNMIVEGYYAAFSAKKINSTYRTKIPIIESVYNILYKDRNPKKVFEKLSKKLN